MKQLFENWRNFLKEQETLDVPKRPPLETISRYVYENGLKQIYANKPGAPDPFTEAGARRLRSNPEDYVISYKVSDENTRENTEELIQFSKRVEEEAQKQLKWATGLYSTPQQLNKLEDLYVSDKEGISGKINKVLGRIKFMPTMINVKISNNKLSDSTVSDDIYERFTNTPNTPIVTKGYSMYINSLFDYRRSERAGRKIGADVFVSEDFKKMIREAVIRTVSRYLDKNLEKKKTDYEVDHKDRTKRAYYGALIMLKSAMIESPLKSRNKEGVNLKVYVDQSGLLTQTGKVYIKNLFTKDEEGRPSAEFASLRDLIGKRAAMALQQYFKASEEEGGADEKINNVIKHMNSVAKGDIPQTSIPA